MAFDPEKRVYDPSAAERFRTLFSEQPTREKLAACFDGLEADTTYIDDTETVIYFSPFRIFERPASILGHSVYDCHKPETRAQIEQMIADFRSGTRDKVSYEHDFSDGRTVRVCYQGMRDPHGVYLGCLEAVTYR